MKRAFTMPEILVAIMLLGFLIVGSVKSFEYLQEAHQINELRYLALNKIDNEMARVVMSYENLNESDFCESSPSGIDISWDYDFDIVENLKNNTYKLYKKNNVSYQESGLLIDSLNKQNIVEIKNLTGTFGKVDNMDVVGLLGWKISSTNKEANISLSIKYPYIINNGNLKAYQSFNETINLKTSTKIKQ